MSRSPLLLVVPLAMALLTLAACEDGGGPSPSPSPTASPVATITPSPTPSPTPVGETGGMEGFRAFAARIEAALAAGDASFFADRGVEDELTCAGGEELGPCAGLPAGTVLTGIPGAAAQSDAFGLFSPDEYATMLEEWFASARPDLSDEYGEGGVVLYALAHRPASASSEEVYLAIVTGIFTSGPSELRQARILSFQFLDGSWRLASELFATVPQTAADWLSGECTECYDQWEPYP